MGISDKDKQVPNETSFPQSRMASHGSADLEDVQMRPTPEMKRPKPSQDSIAAALQAVQRLAAETDVEESTEDAATEFSRHAVSGLCAVCGYQNRDGNKFCAMCGLPVDVIEESKHEVPASEREHSFAPLEAQPEAAAPRMPRSAEAAHGTHHYHHHYHHHYFPAGQESALVRPPSEISREADKLRLTAAGIGEVEVEPTRVEVVGDMAYEAGRCNALVPSATGKRREERGKYLWVFARQSNGEWKLAADCWSSDLTLAA